MRLLDGVEKSDGDVQAVPAPPRAKPPVYEPEEPMKEKKPLAERVAAALKEHGRCALDDLAKYAETTKGTLYASTAAWKKAGILRPVAGERGVYEAGKVEAKPPPKAKASAPKKPKKKARAAKVERQAPPAPKAANGDAQFAINEQGELGIEHHDTKVKLDGRAFARLRAFIDRTKSVWQGVS